MLNLFANTMSILISPADEFVGDSNMLPTIGTYTQFAKEQYHKIEKDKKRLKICIDTCHVFASGYNLSVVSSVKLFLK